MAKSTLTSLATELLVVAQKIDSDHEPVLVTLQQINTAAERWAPAINAGEADPMEFAGHANDLQATAWLRFIDRLEIPDLQHTAGERQIEPFAAYLLDERGLSIHTVRFDRHHMGQFFEWLAAQNRTLAKCACTVDAFTESLKRKGWCRVSMARSVSTLRVFRYAEHHHWCTTGIAAGIERPRLYRDEACPLAPTGAMSNA